MKPQSPRPRGFHAMATFLIFGATMAALAGTTLALPGTFLDSIWRLNPTAYRQLAPLGRPASLAFLLLSTSLLIAAIGWHRRRYWGWLLAAVIIATQVVGDFVNAIRGEVLKGAVGVLVAGLLLFWLFRPKVRNAFR